MILRKLEPRVKKVLHPYDQRIQQSTDACLKSHRPFAPPARTCSGRAGQVCLPRTVRCENRPVALAPITCLLRLGISEEPGGNA